MPRITGVRKQLSRELGFVLPLVRVKDNLSLPGNNYRIVIAGIAIGDDEAWPHELLALDAGDQLDPIDGRRVKDPSFGLDAVWIPEANRSDAVVAGYTVVDASTVITTHLHNTIAGCAASLFGLDDGQAVLDNLKASYPQLVQSLSPQPYSIAAVTGVCRALLAERVPLRDFRQVAEALVMLASRNLELGQLVEAVRQEIGALIVQTIVPVKLPLPVITFEAELEKLLTQSVQAGPEALWPFEPALARRLVSAVNEAVQPMLLAARSFAIVTSPVCRAAVARLLRAQLSEAPVLSFLEIPDDKAVDVIAVVGGESPNPALPADEPDLSNGGY